MNDAKKVIIFLTTLISLCILGWLVLKLTPVLMPFLLAAGIAYLSNPLVEKLTKIPRVPRTLAVCLVFSVILLLVLMFILFIVPILNRETVEFVKIIPQTFLWLQEEMLPRLEAFTGLSMADYDIKSFQATLMKHWTKASNFMTWLGQWLFHSGMTILHWGINCILIIVVTFYLLRDWHKMLKSLKYLIPISYRHQVILLVKKSDTVMSAFLRGQLSVMLVLSIIYAVGLTLIGIPFSVLLGVISGLLSIVPYFGGIIGFLSTIIISLVQNQDGWNLIWIAIVFGVGQILEGFVLTPLFLGDKLGLHPVAVIFAVLAGGQLFGFVGVLLAIPISAILVVLLREPILTWAKTS